MSETAPKTHQSAVVFSLTESKLNHLRQLADIEQVPVSVIMLSCVEADYIRLLKSVITTQCLALASIVKEIDAIKDGDYGSS